MARSRYRSRSLGNTKPIFRRAIDWCNRTYKTNRDRNICEVAVRNLGIVISREKATICLKWCGCPPRKS